MTDWYIPAAVICVIAMIPFFAVYERRRHMVANLTVIASVTAVAVISRAAFYALPQIKPVAAVCVIAGIVFGAQTGFICGALSMLASNAIFGQGPWTPFQMLGLGLTAFICALIFKNKKLRSSRLALALISGAVTFAVYGAIVDTQSVLFYVSEFNIASVAAVYAAGLPMNAIFGVTTGVIMALIGKNAVERLDHISVKYGLTGG